MGRGAPKKPGLNYFPFDVDFFEDDRIFDLLDRYGPLGVNIYICILCIVYKDGYYSEIPLDKLSRMITKMIGNKWVKNKKAVAQVVHFCSEIGLIDDDLMTKNIITSVGIQRRYYEVAVIRMKRQLYSLKYWLLGSEKKAGPLLNAPQNRINSEVNRINPEDIPLTSEESAQKEKESKYKDNNTFHPEELERAFQMYLLVRRANYGDIIPEQVQELRADLLKLSSDVNEQLAIVKKATASGWKSFYKLSKDRPKERKPVKKAGGNNFSGRDYDMKKMEMDLIEK